MKTLIETARTTLSPDQAFDKVAEFANIDQWDPGVVTSTRVTSGDTGVGTAYDLDLSYGGRNLAMRYTVVGFEPGQRVVLEGRGFGIKAIDTITFEPDADGTLVTYRADLSLTGIARLAQPFMGSRFESLGAAAGDGLRRWLLELEAEAHLAD